MREASPDELRAIIAAARAHTAAQREQAHRLEAQLPELNARLGAARLRQERMQQPATLVTEVARHRVERWLVRLRIKRTPA